MKLVRASELARNLGIPDRTMRQWCLTDPKLAIFISGGIGGGSWWVKLERLAERSNISILDAYTLSTQRWKKATELAKLSGISRKTIANWCRNRPGFAKRIGRVYYVDLEQMGANRDEIDALDGNWSQTEDE